MGGQDPLTPSRRRLLLELWSVVTAALLVRAVGREILPPPGMRPVTPWLVDVNRASVGELQALPGVGLARARALVLHRVRHGWFGSTAELARVDGFGPGVVAMLAPYVQFGAH